MKKTLLAAAAVAAFGAALVAPTSAFASNGTITINGQVVSSTCTVAINGNGASPTITLPTVDTNALSASGTTAAYTTVTIALSGCSAVTGYTKVLPYFEQGPNIDTANNYLKNIATTTPAGNVEVLLSTTPSIAGKVSLNGAAGAQNAGTAALLSTANPTFTYYAAYVATGVATAGAVSTSVQYDLNYQ